MLHFNNPKISELSQKEWLVTNGLGGYAAGTIAGSNTRRYHGLLVSAENPPTSRKILVSKTDEIVEDDNHNIFELSTNFFGNVIAPNGYKFIKSFNPAPIPETYFDFNGNKLSKCIFMCYQQNTTVIEYKNLGNQALVLRIKIILNYRDYHGSFNQNSYTDFYTQTDENRLTTYAHYGAKPLFTYHQGEFTSMPTWYKNYYYQIEDERGLSAYEDNFLIGEVKFILNPGHAKYILFTTEKLTEEKNYQPDFYLLKQKELERINKLKTSDNEFLNDLIISADKFLVRRLATNSNTIIAGYHWFTDWGRDTMISMRTMTIVQGKQEISKSIIKTFLYFVDDGMLPNRFPDTVDEVLEYNTIDATLWLFVVLYEYQQKFSDDDFILQVFEILTKILICHKTGTRFNIHETEEGFLFGGTQGSQLTWMDAKVGDFVVTPRHGCAVEIQALWFNSLKIYLFFANRLKIKNELIKEVEQSIIRFEKNFLKYFLNDKGYLNDVIIPNVSVDDSFRCNQIFALSLPFSFIDIKYQKNILHLVSKKLLTPYGLRTLAMEDTNFMSTYEGGVFSRDSAYHQGTVWTFLLSEFVTAYFRINGKTPNNKEAVNKLILPLKEHFYFQNCLHGVSEIFDGENPKVGKGCCHQAWSVAALINIVMQLKT